MQPEPDKLAALIDTARALEAAGVRYALVGGLAVGIHTGLPRATIDVYVAAHLGAGRETAVRALERAGLLKTLRCARGRRPQLVGGAGAAAGRRRGARGERALH